MPKSRRSRTHSTSTDSLGGKAAGRSPLYEGHPVVFPVSAVLIVVLAAAGMFGGTRVQGVFNAVQDWVTAGFGWLYVLSMSGFLILSVFLAASRFGGIRLGRDDDEPEFNTITWFAMLFSAGMGIGLLFWGVAEPLYHYTSPPEGRGGTLDAARESMAITIFHWGLHPWSLYAVVGLALAYFSFRRGLPMSLRSVFHPLLGERIHGRLGDVVDVLAVVATLFGVATSLGLGAMQVNAGLEYLFGAPFTPLVQVLLIGGITAIATVSVVLGLDVGIRRLSEANMVMAALLLVFVAVAGPTLFLANALSTNIGAYLQMLPYNSFWTAPYEEPQTQDWLGSWTVFYWGWWIAWSPFVGMFIARVSKGRTIREFIGGVLIAPTLVGILWLTVFGGSALHQDIEYQKAVAAAEEARLAGAEEPPLPGLATFPVARTGVGGLYVTERGRIVGPRGGVYEVIGDNVLVAPSGERVVVTEEGTIVLPPVGAAGVPPEAGGAGDRAAPYELPPDYRPPDVRIAAEERPLTAAGYLSAPIVTPNGQLSDQGVATVLFVMLEAYPLSSITALIATLCIVLFFVTSSDSASMVIDIIASGGNPNPPVPTRIFWAVLQGIVAAALLLGGGLQALQTASITAALPFCVVIVLMCFSLLKALRSDPAVARPPKDRRATA